MINLRLETIDPMDALADVTRLLRQLSPEKDETYIEKTLTQMRVLDSFDFFGLYDGDQLLGISSAWTTVRIYCGKQLEVDNVIIDEKFQSKGLGKIFFNKIESWAIERGFESVSLNTYVANSRSHKFYFNQGFKILGFHFEKSITEVDSAMSRIRQKSKSC